MSLTTLFARLGAPLANQRWSWGATRADGAVFLRVWTDELEVVEGTRCVRLINRRAYEGEANLGFDERCEHVKMLAEGAEGYAILCTAAKPLARSRKIVSFDAQQVFKLGPLHLVDGDEWAEVVDRISIREI